MPLNTYNAAKEERRLPYYETQTLDHLCPAVRHLERLVPVDQDRAGRNWPVDTVRLPRSLRPADRTGGGPAAAHSAATRLEDLARVRGAGHPERSHPVLPDHLG